MLSASGGEQVDPSVTNLVAFFFAFSFGGFSGGLEEYAGIATLASVFVDTKFD